MSQNNTEFKYKKDYESKRNNKRVKAIRKAIEYRLDMGLDSLEAIRKTATVGKFSEISRLFAALSGTDTLATCENDTCRKYVHAALYHIEKKIWKDSQNETV